MSTKIAMTTHTIDIDHELEHLDPSRFPLNLISSEIRESALPTILNPPHSDLNQTVINDPCKESSSSQINPTPYANASKNPRSATPPDFL